MTVVDMILSLGLLFAFLGIFWLFAHNRLKQEVQFKNDQAAAIYEIRERIVNNEPSLNKIPEIWESQTIFPDSIHIKRVYNPSKVKGKLKESEVED